MRNLPVLPQNRWGQGFWLVFQFRQHRLDPKQYPHKLLHASCVSVEGRGILILGPAGSGKSSLALKLMGLGADLVSDDRTFVRRTSDRLIATCPDTIKGQIEARGVGLLTFAALDYAELALVVDLSLQIDERLPNDDTFGIFGITLRCIGRSRLDAFAEAVYFLAKGVGSNDQV